MRLIFFLSVLFFPVYAQASPQLPEGVGELIIQWAPYLVGSLALLLYQLTKEKLKEEKEAYMREIKTLKGLLDKTLTREDFEKHERREDKDRDERRAAEDSVRQMVGTLDRRMDIRLGDLDTKMDAKLDTIINNMLAILQTSRK
jgi:hypothetical protein